MNTEQRLVGNYSSEYPKKPGYYFVHNGHIELVAFIFENSSSGELMYNTLPSIRAHPDKLSNARDGLLWCRIDSPNDSKSSGVESHAPSIKPPPPPPVAPPNILDDEPPIF